MKEPRDLKPGGAAVRGKILEVQRKERGLAARFGLIELNRSIRSLSLSRKSVGSSVITGSSEVPVLHSVESMSLTHRWSVAVVVFLVLIAPTAAPSAPAAAPFDHEHAAWRDLLRDHVTWQRGGHHSVVDYHGLKDDPRLDRYVASLANVPRQDFLGWTRAQQLAFLLNAYNAYTVAFVAGYYPKIDSIKDIGGWYSPWSYEFVPLFGEKVSLDHIEHDLIRGDEGFQEPRIHFAVNCASASCPALRPEAYTADGLESQLQDAEKRFLTDRTRNRLDVERRHLEVSPIFDWYGEDFGSAGNLKQYFAARAELLSGGPGGRQVLRAQRFTIGFGEYDWSLNDVQAEADRRD